MAPSSTTHLPPVLCLLLALCPVLALTCQPVSVLPSKMETKPSSAGCAFGASAMVTLPASKSTSTGTIMTQPHVARFMGCSSGFFQSDGLVDLWFFYDFQNQRSNVVSTTSAAPATFCKTA